MQNSKDQKIKYVIYARKSQEASERQALSLESQLDVANDLVRKEGLTLLAAYQESKSGMKPYRRPVFDEMVRKLRKGEATGIICWKLDRLARNPEEAGIIIGMLQRGEIAHIRTAEREYRPEDNAVISYLDFAIADQYSKELSQNVKRGIAKKLRMGWHPSYAPLGYMNTKLSERGSNTIVKDPDRFDVVRKLWQLMLTGNYTVPQLLKISNDRYGLTTRRKNKPLSRTGLYSILSNPFYYGELECPKGSGNLYKGSHEPMITRDEYNHVQVLLGRKDRPRPKQRVFTYTGIMRCGTCGCAVTAELKVKRQKNGNVHEYVYYHCTKRGGVACPEVCLRLDRLEGQIIEQLGMLVLPKPFLDWAIKYLLEIKAKESKFQVQVERASRIELSDIDKRLESLLLRFTAPENAKGVLISEDEYRALKANLLGQKIAIEARLNEYTGNDKDNSDLAKHVFDFATHARTNFVNGDEATRRAIFSSIGSNHTLKDGKVSIDLHKVLKLIENGQQTVGAELESVRTPEKALDKTKNEHKAHLNVQWRGRRDSNPRPFA